MLKVFLFLVIRKMLIKAHSAFVENSVLNINIPELQTGEFTAKSLLLQRSRPGEYPY